MTDEDVQVVRAAWEAWRDEGPRGILAFLHPEIEWTPAEGEPESETCRGIDAVTRLVCSWQDAFSEFRPESQEFDDAGEAVLVSLCFSARAHGGGAVMELPETHVVRVREGKIAEVSAFRTVEEARRALRRPF